MTAQPAPRETGTVAAGALRPVAAQPRTLSRLPFVGFVALLMALGMVGVLVLSTVLQEQAFVVQKAQLQATQLGYQVADLEAEVKEARSTTSLAIKASQLGLRPNIYPVYLKLPEGVLVGDPTAVTGGELPQVHYRTPEQLQAEAEARAAAAAERARQLKEQAKAREEALAKKKAEEAAAAKKKAEEAAAAEKKADAAAAKKQNG